MEKWQIDIIVKNQDKLIQQTNCNDTLLSKLTAAGILCDEDVEQLRTHRANGPSQSVAYNFYKLLTQRKQGFETLLEGLRQTNQSGVLAILDPVKPQTSDISSLKYDKDQILGRGSYATVVFKGDFCNRQVAVKRVLPDVIDWKVAEHEINVLRKCDAHENIVRYFGCKREADATIIVLELCDMTLKDWVGNKSIEIEPVEILRQVTVGLEWLHTHKIIHRDLKPENILLVRRVKKVKISDFGLSRRIVDGRSSVTTVGVCGTHGWVAAEILSQYNDRGHQQHKKCKFTIASDVFALGCVYYYVLSDGKHPFGGFYRCQGNILDGKDAIHFSDIRFGCPQNAEIIKLAISKESQLRPDCSKLLSSPIFWSVTDQVRILQHIKQHHPILHQRLTERESMTATEAKELSEIPENHEPENCCLVVHAYLDCWNTKGACDLFRRSPSGEFQIICGSRSNVRSSPWQTIRNLALNVYYPVYTSPFLLFANLTPFKRASKPAIRNDSSSSKPIVIDKKTQQIVQELKKMNTDNKISKLFEVVRIENLETIQGVLDLVAEGMKITENCGEWYDLKSLLHIAVEHRDYNVVEYLVKTREFSKVLDQERFKSLIHSCIHNIHKIGSEKLKDKFKILDLLFGIRPTLVESKNKFQQTPLHIATGREFVNGKQVEFIKLLLKHNAFTNAKDETGKTPLHLAVGCKSLAPNLMEVVQLLIKNGADPDAFDRKGIDGTFLHVAASSTDFSPKLFHNLVAYLVSIGKTRSFGMINSNSSTVFHLAVYYMELQTETVGIFKSTGIDFKAKDSDGNSILFRAIMGGRKDIFLALLTQTREDWKVLNNEKDTAMHMAARYCNLSALKLFISWGFNVNEQNVQLNTPLHEVTLKYNNENAHAIVSELLKSGANVNVRNKMGMLPIDSARQRVEDGFLEQRTVELLETFKVGPDIGQIHV